MDAVASVRLDHPTELEIAADRAQLHVGEPLPRRALLFQVVKKSFRTRHQRSILAVRPQTQIDAIQVALARDTRKRGDHQFNETRVSLILRQRLDWGWDQGVVSKDRKSTRLNSSH